MSIVGRLLARDPAPSAGLTFEPLRRRHLRAVEAIEEQVYPRPWTHGVFTSEIDQVRRGNRYYAVALAAPEGQLLGYGGVMLNGEEAHVTNIAVDPAQHRRGVGRRLLVHLAREARAVGATSLSLEVRVSNAAAQEMYRRFGFAPAGIRQRYYENTEDAIVMWVHDIDSDDYADRLDRLDAPSALEAGDAS